MNSPLFWALKNAGFALNKVGFYIYYSIPSCPIVVSLHYIMKCSLRKVVTVLFVGKEFFCVNSTWLSSNVTISNTLTKLDIFDLLQLVFRTMLKSHIAASLSKAGTSNHFAFIYGSILNVTNQPPHPPPPPPQGILAQREGGAGTRQIKMGARAKIM